jgi:hypothetical protein
MKTQSIKSFFLITLVGFIVISCQFGQNPQSSEILPQGTHKGVVKEVLQTTNYTYLLLTENKTETWVALPKMEAKAGDTYYYTEGMEMNNFESKELGRTFETVYFIQSVSTTLDKKSSETMAYPHSSKATKAEKREVDIQPASGGITIAELFANKESYAGKTVRIKGEVTKFNGSIMDRNWVHIQDGTEYEGKFDLTATTDVEIPVGEVVTLEGVVAINQDFGYGYAYEILLEKAVLIRDM